MRPITGRLARYLPLLLLACEGRDALDGYPAPTAPPVVREEGCRLPLAKTHVTIPFGGGLQGDVDPKLLAIGKLVTGTNIRQLRQGEWIARPGTTALSTALLGSADVLPAPWALATLKDCLTSLSGPGVDHPANVWSPTTNQWVTDRQVALSTASAIQTQQRGPITARPTQISGQGRNPDIAYGSGYYFVIYQTAPAPGAPITIHEVVIDATTGQRVLDKQQADGLTTVRNMAVRVVNGYVVYVRDTTANDLAFDYWQISNLDGVQTTATFATTTGATEDTLFDILVKDATTISVAYSDGTNAQAVDFVPSTGTLTGWTPKDAAAANIPCNYALNWLQDFGGSGKIALITHSSTQGVRVQWNIPTVGATRQTGNTYVVDAAATIGAVTGHTTASSASGTFWVFYDYQNAAAVLTAGIKGVNFLAGALTISTTFCRGVHLRSKTWTHGGEFYVTTEHMGTAQNTRFVHRVTSPTTLFPPAPLVIAQVRSGQTGGQLSAVVSPVAGTWTSANAVQTRLISQPTEYTPSNVGVDLLPIAFRSAGDTTYGPAREAIGSLLVPGGALLQFDGSTYAEAGFPYYPGQPNLTAGAGGGLTSASTYYYALTYLYPDDSGRLWRSAPSITKSVVMGANTKVTLDCPTLQTAGRSNVVIEVWRGGANGSATLQLVGTVANNHAADSVSFVDTVPDTTQAFGEELYTNGGILANDAIPGFVAVAVAGNRLYGVSGDDRRVIWVSNEFVPGRGLVFSEDNLIRIDDQHGDLTALSAQPNGIVLAYKADAVYAIGGAGPDAAGNGSFSVQTVSIGLGTTNPRSIVEGSFGAEFKSTSSRAGWYRIGLGLTPEYIGGPVQAYVGETVVGAVLVPALSETRYYTATAMVLVHNLVTDVWSVDQLNYGSVTAATAYNGGAAFSAGSTVFVDLPGSIADNGNAYDLTLETPWMKMADLKGYQHFYRVQGVGENPTPGHAVTVALFKDFDDAGLGTPKSVTPGVLWDWERRYAAKVHALKVKLTITTGGVAPGPKMSAMVIEYGVKQGMGRIAAAKRTA